MLKVFKTYLWLLALTLITACAQVRSLPGGDRDKTPPLVLASQPEHLSTQFSGSGFELVFDEYVQLNNINQELIISPPLQKPPSVKIRKKSVVVSWKEELLPNTTYQFNFGDGVVDVNENNIVKDLLYVFSTGDHIDSLFLEGVVHDVFNDQPCNRHKVLLYETDTSVFSRKPAPVYFARTKEDGSFRLSYLKEGSFYLYSIDDLNSNYGWNDSEAFAFSDTMVRVTNNDSTKYLLHSSIPFPEKLIIENYTSDSTGYLKFAVHPHFNDITVESLSGLQTSVIRNGDTLVANIRGVPTDRMEQLVVGRANDFYDTLQIPFFTEAQRNRFKLNVRIGQKIKHTDLINILSSSLMTLEDQTQVSIKRDSLAVDFRIFAGENESQFNLTSNWVTGGNYECLLTPGLFRNSAGGTNDTLRFKFEVYKTEELGMIEFELETPKPKSEAFLELLNKNNEVVFMTNDLSSGIIRINGLPAMEYTARIVEDYNRNGLYDPADPIHKIQPEITHVYPGKINVRSNWELKLKW